MRFLSLLSDIASLQVALDYVPLPGDVVKQIEQSWAANLKGADGKAVWTVSMK